MMDLTWTCHVCGDERPDAAISVAKQTKVLAGIEVSQNVRYCNDRPECAKAAASKLHIPWPEVSG